MVEAGLEMEIGKAQFLGEMQAEPDRRFARQAVGGGKRDRLPGGIGETAMQPASRMAVEQRSQARA